MFYTFGRIGCLLAGCCYGIESFWVIHFPFDAEEIFKVPIQAFESIFNFTLLIGLLLYEKIKAKDYLLLPKYLFCYSIFRFFIEFFKSYNIRGIWNGLLTLQWISLVIFIIVVFVFLKKSLKILSLNTKKTE